VFFRVLPWFVLLLTLLAPAPAHAHQTIINAVKLDVRPRDHSVAAVFRLNVLPTRAWLERTAKSSDLAQLAEHRDAFAAYLLARVGLSHAGGPCQNAGKLYVLHHDAQRESVLATTSFKCGARLPSALRFHSTLFAEETIAQDLIVQVENQGRRGTFILNTQGRTSVDFDIAKLVDIGGALRQQYDASKVSAALGGDLRSAPHVDDPRRGMTPLALLYTYVVEGFLHILSGLDHLLFVLSLLLAVTSLRQLVIVLSMFTVGHSVSLALGAFDVIRIRPAVIEPLVALTILLVVADNLLRKEPARQRAFWALGFGVIHGFAFSQTLWDLEVLASIAMPLLGFNLGVELGQLLLVLPLAPLLAWLRRARPAAFAHVYRAASGLVGCAAAYWLVERLVGM
jgi:hydrogenase/urease accessory protein HupE